MRRTAAGLFLLAALTAPALAHEARPAYLEVTEKAPGRYALLWRTPVNAGMRLPVALQLPESVKTIGEPVRRELPGSLLERRTVEVPGGALAGLRIDFPGLQATITDVLVRVAMRDGRKWSTIVRPARPWVEIEAAQGPAAVAGEYVFHGIRHILSGPDHLLFVFGLLLIVRDRWMLLKTVTAFTAAHSITLAAATLGRLDVPIVPVDAAIALSVFFLGPEIVRSWRGETSFTIRHPWVVAFCFGLLHGFGFAGALTSAGLPRADLPIALLSFNVGVEIGQIGFILVVLLLEAAAIRLRIHWPRWATALPGYAVGTLGAFWFIQRTAVMLGLTR